MLFIRFKSQGEVKSNISSNLIYKVKYLILLNGVVIW